jgi:hypothetical protein
MAKQETYDAAALSHEMGHASRWSEKPFRGKAYRFAPLLSAIPGIVAAAKGRPGLAAGLLGAGQLPKLYEEAMATRRAHKTLKSMGLSEPQRKEIRKDLRRAGGSHLLASASLPLVGAGGSLMLKSLDAHTGALAKRRYLKGGALSAAAVLSALGGSRMGKAVEAHSGGPKLTKLQVQDLRKRMGVKTHVVKAPKSNTVYAPPLKPDAKRDRELYDLILGMGGLKKRDIERIKDQGGVVLGGGRSA